MTHGPGMPPPTSTEGSRLNTHLPRLDAGRQWQTQGQAWSTRQQDRPWEPRPDTVGQARHCTTEGPEGGAPRAMLRQVAQVS